MNLDFLDCGIPIEPDYSGNSSKIMGEFRKYCKELGKDPSELTEEDFQRFYKIIESIS